MTSPAPALPHDRTLADGVRAGDPAAMSEVYVRHGPALVRAAYGLTGSAQDAEDIVQDLFVGLPEAIGKFDGSGSLGGWLRRVVARMALMRLRAGRRRREDDDAEIEVLPRVDRALDALADRLTLDQALRALPVDLRVVFVLKEVEGYRHDEIAGLLGIRRNTAEVRLHRARKLLQRLLGDDR